MINKEFIDDLLKEAGVKLKARRPFYDDDPNGYVESDNDFMFNNQEAIITLLEGGLEKFAESIVRECATLAYDGPNGILEHFGVEE